LFSGGTAADEGPILFFDDDQRGKEGIKPEDCLQFEVTIDPARLLLSMVAGARNQQYPQLWRPGA